MGKVLMKGNEAIGAAAIVITSYSIHYTKLYDEEEDVITLAPEAAAP